MGFDTAGAVSPRKLHREIRAVSSAITMDCLPEFGDESPHLDCFDSLSFSIPGRNLALHVHRTTLEGVSKRVFTHVKVTPINK